MEKIFESMPENIYPIIFDYIKVIVPSLITYLITKYSLSKPTKYEIKKQQFDNVYLPLYLLTKQMMKPGTYSKNLSLYIKKVDKIIYKNYQFVFPKTLKLFEKVKLLEHSDSQNTYHIINFEFQIDSDYEKLKRELGYPTNSFFEFFKRLNWFNKIIYSLLLICTALFIYGITDSFLLFLKGDIINAVSAFTTAVFIGFFIYLFSYPSRH